MKEPLSSTIDPAPQQPASRRRGGERGGTKSNPKEADTEAEGKAMRPSSVSCLFYFCLSPPILEEGAEVHGGVLPSFFFCRRDAGGLHLGAGYRSDPTREGGDALLRVSFHLTCVR